MVNTIIRLCALIQCHLRVLELKKWQLGLEIVENIHPKMPYLDYNCFVLCSVPLGTMIGQSTLVQAEIFDQLLGTMMVPRQ